MTTTLESAVTTAEELFAQGRIARWAWRRTKPDGREAVCAWIALGGAEDDYGACAALGISEALARLIPWLDDAGSEEAWRPRMMRLFSLLRRTPVLRAEDWTALDFRWRRIAIEEAMRHTDDERVRAACRAVVGLCARAEAGEPVARDEWYAAWTALHAASVVDAPVAEQAVTSAASWATEVGANIAMATAMAVSSATTATCKSLAPEAACGTDDADDRLADAILDALEERITAREAA